MVTLDSQAPIIMFNEILENTRANYTWMNAVTKITGTSGVSDLSWLGSLPPMVEYADPTALTRTLEHFEWHVRHFRYIQGLELGDTRGRTESDALQANIRMILARAIEQAYGHISTSFWNLLITGDATACYTGSTFFNAAHVIEDTTVNNTVPSTADFEADLETAIGQMLSFRHGNNIDDYHVNESGLYVIAPIQMRAEILRILNSYASISGTTIIGSPASGYGITPIFSARLGADDPADWYLVRSTDEKTAFVYSSIVDPILEPMVKPFETDPDKYRVYVDYGMTYGDPRNAIKIA